MVIKQSVLLILLSCITYCTSFAQLGVNYHQSAIPFIGLTYDIRTRLVAELRLATDVEISNFSPELIVAYKFASNENFNFYGGVGGRANVLTGLVVPLGFALYPFDNKQFGFHIEATPLIGEELVLRGSWGIRFRFKNKE